MQHLPPGLHVICSEHLTVIAASALGTDLRAIVHAPAWVGWVYLNFYRDVGSGSKPGGEKSEDLRPCAL